MRQMTTTAWAVAVVLALLGCVLRVHADMNYHPVRLHGRGSNMQSKFIVPSKVIDVSSIIDKKANKKWMEGEKHGSPNVPDGAILTSLDVGDTGTQIPAYWTSKPENHKATHAFVMFHGRLRDGDRYWSVMNHALESAQKDNFDGVPKHAIVVAPQFYSHKLNLGQYNDSTLAWDDVNSWQSGSVAVHPHGTAVSSVDAVDAIVDHFSDSSKYPKMKNLTLVGHGGGGQLMNRYATVGKDASRKGLYIRYIVGDPSSSAYFTHHRPLNDKSIASIDDCPSYNNWRYGFDHFPGTLSSNEHPRAYYKRYINRDVVNIVGYKDVAHNGDQKCMALLQGGHKRRDRNLSWWRYINMIGGTNENLHGFPGDFSDLPDWSDDSNGIIMTRLTVVPDASHDASAVFGGKHGRSALFSRYDVEMGWRPDGWSYHEPRAKYTEHSNWSSSSGSSGSSGSSNMTHSNAHVRKDSNKEQGPNSASDSGSQSSAGDGQFYARSSGSRPLWIMQLMGPMVILLPLLVIL